VATATGTGEECRRRSAVELTTTAPQDPSDPEPTTTMAAPTSWASLIRPVATERLGTETASTLRSGQISATAAAASAAACAPYSCDQRVNSRSVPPATGVGQVREPP